MNVAVSRHQPSWLSWGGLRPFIGVIRSSYRLYDAVLLRADGQAFCALFNFKAAVLGWDVRFYYDASAQQFIARSKAYQRFFFHKTQANYAYRGGMGWRATTLGQDYFLGQIQFSAGDVVVDCGANVGDLLLYFKEHALDIKYIGIEPSPLEYKCLAVNVAPHQTYNIGLWHEDSELTFYVSAEGADSSVIAPPSYDSVTKVQVKRLDSFFNGPIKLLKIEAEGAEPEALRGCEKLFPQIEYISADLGFERGVNQESTLVPVVNYLLQHGFELIDMSHDRIVALFRNKTFRA